MQTILPIVSRSISATLAAALLLSMTGCVTSTLWSSGEMRHFYEPASPPRLELFHDPKQGDVLAAYDEAHETRKTIRRRAYFVNRNRTRIEAGLKPRFVNPERAQGLTPIALAQPTGQPLGDSAAIQAVVSTNRQQFTLSGDFGGHDYRLPVYQDQGGVAGRILLSPFAVTADAVLVATVVGAVAAYVYAYERAGGGNSYPK